MNFSRRLLWLLGGAGLVGLVLVVVFSLWKPFEGHKIIVWIGVGLLVIVVIFFVYYLFFYNRSGSLLKMGNDKPLAWCEIEPKIGLLLLEKGWIRGCPKLGAFNPKQFEILRYKPLKNGPFWVYDFTLDIRTDVGGMIGQHEFSVFADRGVDVLKEGFMRKEKFGLSVPSSRDNRKHPLSSDEAMAERLLSNIGGDPDALKNSMAGVKGQITQLQNQISSINTPVQQGQGQNIQQGGIE